MVRSVENQSPVAVDELLAEADLLARALGRRVVRFHALTMEEGVSDARAEARIDRETAAKVAPVERRLRAFSREVAGRIAAFDAGHLVQPDGPQAKRGLARRLPLRRLFGSGRRRGADAALPTVLAEIDRMIGALSEHRKAVANLARTLDLDLEDASKLWRERMRELGTMDPEGDEGEALAAAGLDAETGRLEVTLSSGESLYEALNRHVIFLDALTAKLKLEVERGVVLQIADGRSQASGDEQETGGYLATTIVLGRERRLSYPEIEGRHLKMAAALGEIDRGEHA